MAQLPRRHPVDVLLRGQWRRGLGRVAGRQVAADGTTEVQVVIDIAGRNGQRQAPDRTWLRSWVGSVTAGELAGFCVPLLAIALVVGSPREGGDGSSGAPIIQRCHG